MTFLKITNITVAITVAAVVSKAEMNVQMAKGKDHHLEYSTIGARKMLTKFIHTPVKKKPNIRWLAILIRFKMLLISAGKAMVAPASSSLSRISMGLNQYRVCVGEQCVIPSSL
jgi:hypothetical protein